MDDLTLAVVLTAAGVTVSSGLVTGLVQLFNTLLGSAMEGKERLAAFVLSALLVVVAYIAGVQDGTITTSIQSIFAAFLAWYGIARLSMANYADVTAEINSLRGPEENRPGGGD